MLSRAIVILLGLIILLPAVGMAVIHDIAIQSFNFVPGNQTINQGDTVRWTNNDAFLHTSTSDAGIWNSGDMANGQSYMREFGSIGTFPYHCSHHLSMRDTITVNSLPVIDLQINIGEFLFDPAVAQISPGQTIRWMNMGLRTHTSTSNDGFWNSDSIAPGGHFDFTFTSEGVYHYHCEMHPLLMHGTVIVGKPDSVAFDIHIVDFAFVPADTTVMLGQNVRWINFGANMHTSTDTSANHWNSGTLDPGNVFTLHADSAGVFHYICLFHPGMNGTLTIADTASGGNCHFVVGDINGNGVANGIDVTYGVGYFKGGPVPPISCDCPPHGVIFPAGDVNGNCTFNGIDITYYVSYLKGGPHILPCPDCLVANLLRPAALKTENGIDR